MILGGHYGILQPLPNLGKIPHGNLSSSHKKVYYLSSKNSFPDTQNKYEKVDLKHSLNSDNIIISDSV